MIKTLPYLVVCGDKSHLTIGPIQCNIFSLIISLKKVKHILSEKYKQLVENDVKFC
jgi:hypothetical protein